MPRSNASVVVGAAIFGAVAVMALTQSPTRAAPPPQTMQYQGRLTDSNGRPLEGTIGKLTFRLFSAVAPLDTTTFVWGEAHTNVPVRRGVFTVALGDGQFRVDGIGAETAGHNPLLSQHIDGSARWIQVQVDGDPPLAPPTRIGAVPLAITAGGVVPVGGIVDWYRPSTSTPIPSGWVVCDGATVNDPESPFNLQPVPNLVGRFVRGMTPALLSATGYGAGAIQPLPDQGGSDTLNLSHSHSVFSHTHGISSDGLHRHNTPGWSGNTTFISFADPSRTSPAPAFFGGTFGDHGHSVSIPSQPTDDAGGHSHGGATQPGGGGGTTASLGVVSTVPQYVGLLKIIRIK